jgi:hypothetical protein
MTKAVYVASALANYALVLELQAGLAARGVGTAFDWAARRRAELAGGRVLTANERTELAAEMEAGVRRADALLLVCPGKRGAHVEFGIAVGCGKPAVVCAPDPAEDISFYKLPSVRLVRDLATALEETVRAVG